MKRSSNMSEGEGEGDTRRVQCPSVISPRGNNLNDPAGRAFLFHLCSRFLAQFLERNKEKKKKREKKKNPAAATLSNREHDNEIIPNCS